SLVITIAVPTTSRFGPIRQHAPWRNLERLIWANVPSRCLCKTHIAIFYLSFIFLFVLTIDVWKALWFVDATNGKSSFGIGVGTIVLAINVVLLGGYTFGCHSLRHLAGGFLDQFSKSRSCYRAYACVSCFNRRHMLWAWLSLFWVGFA